MRTIENKYIFSKTKNNYFNFHEKIDEYYLNHNYDSTYIKKKIKANKFLIIIGDFIDGQNPDRKLDEILDDLFKFNDIGEFIEGTKYFAGRFLILKGNKRGLDFVLTDPACTIPVNYTFSDEGYTLSSHAKFIADEQGYTKSETSLNIKENGEQSQPLPYNITMYDEIKILIPNHFLNIREEKMERFFPNKYLKETSLNVSVDETIEIAQNIIKGFLNTRKLSVPMTSGMDSRVVLALLKDYISDIEMYTFNHSYFTDNSDDIKIPTSIASDFNINYEKISVKPVPDESYEMIKHEMDGLEADYVLNNGYTYSQTNISDYHSVPGDIIDISKSMIGRDLPESLATTNFFVTKIHNYSPAAKEYVNNWVEDTKDISKKFNVSLYDLFHLESRTGRWLTTGLQNYDYFTNRVHIFNCRYLIESWMSVPRKERTKDSFHLKMIEKLWPELLDYPINPDDKIKDTVFSNSYLYFFGTHAKYALDKYKNN